MRVLHVIPSLSVKEGGPSFAAKTMAEALAGQGVQVTVATTTGSGEPPSDCRTTGQRDNETEESREWQGIRTTDHGLLAIAESEEGEDAGSGRHGEGAAADDRGYSIVCFRREFEPYKISFGLAKWLSRNATKFDLIHIHALFSFSSTMAARIARKKSVPYIVRPLGVLNRWGMKNRRRIPKLISFRFVELPLLLRAATVHYTSEAERDEAALLDARLAEHEPAVIPLPIEQRAWSKEQRAESRQQFLVKFPRARGKRVVLFLSRIDRKKGIELLIDAFAMVREKNREVALVIAGDGEKAYVRELRERAKRVDHDHEHEHEHEHNDVIWTGHLGGEMKAAALAAADVFVLPSASENFGIAAAESLAAGVPTVVSEEVALSSDIRRYDAGMVVKRDVQQLAGTIADLLSNRERVASLAANGRRLVEDRYSPEAVGKALHELYQKCIASRT